MNAEFISPEETIDVALRKASFVVWVASFPAFSISIYRNIFLEFLPVHSLLITMVWISFLLFSLKSVGSKSFRFYGLTVAFLILFFVTGYRNQSMIVADYWIIIAGGLLALRQSLWTILFVTLSTATLLYLIIDEIFIFQGVTWMLQVSLHSCSLLLSFVLYSAIRNIVTNYHNIYELQMETNAYLVEKNKRSYLLVEEAEETKNEETKKLRFASFSLYSQLKKLQELIKLAKANNDASLLANSTSRLEGITEDLFEFSESGKFISGKTTDLTIFEFAQILENFIKPNSLPFLGGLELVVTTNEKNETIFQFPVNFLKVLLHHLIEHSITLYSPKELRFDFKMGQKARSMHQIKLSLFIYSENDLSEEDFSAFNKNMASKSLLDSEDKHSIVIKTVLRRLSGSLEASHMGNAARYEISFWVDKF